MVSRDVGVNAAVLLLFWSIYLDSLGVSNGTQSTERSDLSR
jgi:hypothetical protein